MTAFKEQLISKVNVVESWLKDCLAGNNAPKGLQIAMEYSLHAGGKRIRPILCLSSAALFSSNVANFLPFACAIECIHTYSLIHDDLPAMDDDDLRRGRPSSHKQFDEATAILAGDALLTDAFSMMASTPIAADNLLKALMHVANAAGSQGMVGGQYLDMQYTAKQSVQLADLAMMHAMKTGALLAAPCLCGAILAGASDDDQQRLLTYGKLLGVAFQIADDILDEIGTEEELGKPVGSDKKHDKTTYPSLLGLTESRKLARQKSDEAIKALDIYSGSHADFLRDIAQYVVTRIS